MVVALLAGCAGGAAKLRDPPKRAEAIDQAIDEATLKSEGRDR